MRITDVKINGMVNPAGYLFESVRCAWKVQDTKAKRAVYSKLEVYADSTLENLIYTKEGSHLCSAGEILEIGLTARTRYYVQISVTNELGDIAVSDIAYFETSKQEEAWEAQWITTDSADQFHPIFFREFELVKKVKSARLYISGLGLFCASLNGQKIGREVLTPYYSNYHDEIQYITYDITELLSGENRIEVTLGNGWYKGRFGLAGKKENFGSRFQMIAELRVIDEEDKEIIIGTDESWSYTASDIEASDIYDGETVNRMLWDKQQAICRKAVPTVVKGGVIERYSLPVLEMEELPVKEIIHTPAGETVLDFGQNFTGYPVFRSCQPAGTKIILDFGEILQHGNFYNANYRSAKSQFIYISNGQEEVVRPTFTFFGFRYIRVTGWTGGLKADDFTGRAVYSSMPVTGRIETGHQGVNQLFANTMWGQKSNSLDFPTDCPQRDERLGWTGDAQVFAGTASYNMDTAAFYNKFIHDLRTEQNKLDGILPGVIPVFDPGAAIFSSIWGDIATFLPTVLYAHFGDRYALKQYYPMMKDWVDKITREDQARGQQYLYNFGNQLGDWLALDGRTEQSMQGGTDEYFIGSCYYAASVQKTAAAAKVLGYTEDEQYYMDLYHKIYEAVLAEYFSTSGRLAIDTQTGYIVSLCFGIYKEKELIVAGLRNRLYKDCYKLKGGFVGAPLMCRVMAENGMEDEAFYFLLQEDYPGWMHCINLGATTIWERWNSVLPNGLLSGTMMNSLNHYAYGSIVEYLYRDVAGLKPLVPGFKKAEISPLLHRALGYMKMIYDSAYGKYRVEWKLLEDGKVAVDIEVPFECQAVIRLPFYDGEPIEAEAGSYHFEYQPIKPVQRLYTEKTLFKDIVKNPQAVEIIQKVSPLLAHFLSGQDEEFLHESLDTLVNKSFLGFSEAEIQALTSQLTAIE